jgi:hypothetical protein
VVSGGGATQLLDTGRGVVDRRCVDPDEAALGIDFEPRSKLQVGDAVPIHGD